ncbi:hypothetical protein KVT40_005966 [Elsinoe batatas]|uniref:Suppressor of anucleate metulae protein B n=1 Tax=Elsinoe batatas TaxID=2601811 RepID=A0A8K0KYF2_9PEZI|nr:hypothetical protein KVT40_005966 [Elsinoe batatas]
MAEPCTSCDKPGSTCCSKCQDCPTAADFNRTTSTWYCGEECRREDAEMHKEECKAAYQRRMLQMISRAAYKVMLEYRKLTFDNPITGAIEEGETAYIIMSSEIKQTEEYGLQYSLPAEFDDLSEEWQDTILLWRMCIVSAVMLAPLLKCITRGLVVSEDSILVHSLDVKDVGRHILVKYDGEPDADEWAHKVVEVRLESEEHFMLDITGSQFGWQELVVPVERYLADRVQEGPREVDSISDFCDALFAKISNDKFFIRLRRYYQKLERLTRNPSLYQPSPIRGPESRDDTAVEVWLDDVVADYVRRMQRVVESCDAEYAEQLRDVEIEEITTKTKSLGVSQ